MASNSQTAFWALVILLVLTMGVFFWPNGNWFRTSFQDLLPNNTQSKWVDLANQQVMHEFDRTLIVLVYAAKVKEAEWILEQIAVRLQSEGYTEERLETQQVRVWRDFYELLYRYRWNFLSAEHKALFSQGTRAFFEHQRNLLYSPLGGSLAASLDADPTGVLNSYFRTIFPTDLLRDDLKGEKSAQMGSFLMNENMMRFSHLADLYTVYRELKRWAEDNGAELYMTGAPLYSGYGAQSAKTEVSTIGLASLAFIGVIIPLLLGSFYAFVMTVCALLISMLGALVITVLLLREIHVLTIVFGATLIGVGVDYCFHYLCSLERVHSSKLEKREVFRALTVASISTAIAFGSLALMPFPGIRQIGVFMGLGVAFTILQVIYVFPIFGPSLGNRFSGRYFSPALANLGLLGSIFAAVLILIYTIFGIQQLQPMDDVRAFYSAPTMLQDDERKVRAQLEVVPRTSYFLVVEESSEKLFQSERRLILKAKEHAAKYDETIALGGITQMLPSYANQQENFVLLSEAINSDAFDQYMLLIGFDHAAIKKARSELPERFSPLTLATLGTIDLPAGIGGYLGCQENECASWVRVMGDAGLSHFAENLGGWGLVDPIDGINTQIASHRSGVLTALIIVVALILMAQLAILGLSRTLNISAIPVLTLAATAGTIGYLSSQYSIIDVLALLLVAGIAIDYSVFRAMNAKTRQGGVSLAILMSATTSLLAFGLLAFSATPALSDFGRTVAVGVTIAWALSWIRFSASVE